MSRQSDYEREEQVGQAAWTAQVLHAGQKDKSGKPYINHLNRVAGLVRNSGGTVEQECAAWLHDSIEDTEATVDDFYGISEAVKRIVLALTHERHQPYAKYIHQVLAEPQAVLVKLCDIHDNLSPKRMSRLDQTTQNRLRIKYGKALIDLASNTPSL